MKQFHLKIIFNTKINCLLISNRFDLDFISLKPVFCLCPDTINIFDRSIC